MATSDDFERAFAENDPPRRGAAWGGGRPGGKTLLWVAVAFLMLAVLLVMGSGQGGIVEVGASEVAVLVNYLSGKAEPIQQPGYHFFVPFMQQAFVFDKSTQEFRMEGERDLDENHVRKLTVRAKDGSNFWFDEITILYQIQPEFAALLLQDSGPDSAFKKNWVRAYARSILRDEFGRFSASEVADPSVYSRATHEARDRLNEALASHYIEIVQITTPRPKFDSRYEQAIEDRKVANQEVERIKARAEQLGKEREMLLAQIESEKFVEYEELLGTLELNLKSAQKDRTRVERSADAYKTRLVGEGQAALASMGERARGMTEKALKEAEGLKAKTEALAKQGEILVRERLAQRLVDMNFTLVPYTRDASPQRFELQGDGLATGGGR
jgi:membrane protease subunit HflC